MERIYNVEQHIDVKKIENILELNKDKRIFVFGGGTALEILMEKLLYKYSVAAIFDNNRKLWGNYVNNVEIVDPQQLEAEKKGTYIVLILSKHVHDISLQLESFGLLKGIDYYDIYNEFLEYFRIKKFDNTTAKFLQFLDNIPENCFDNIKPKKKQIGIVCIAMMIQADAWYPMLQALLLCYNGYDTTLIIDNLKSYDDIMYFDGIQEITEIYTDYVVEKLKQKCPILKVKDVRCEGKEVLDDADEKHIEYYSNQVLRWLDSRKDEVFLPNDSRRNEISCDILRKNLKVIKAFFEKNHYDAICLLTGLHRHRNLYTYECQKRGIRVSTYDSEPSDISFYNAYGVVSHAVDINELIKNEWFTKDEKDCIVALAKEHFKQRRFATHENGIYSFQRVSNQNNIEKKYDVIIPLNIAWDAAALARDNIFTDYIEWLNETIAFLMQNTDVSVMIREHPAQFYYKEYNYKEIKNVLNIHGYEDRIYLCKAEEKINTYQYIEMAKLVLPYTSTIGLEAIFMGKPIILHTNCYYDNMIFSQKATNKQDYFDKIAKVLRNGYEITERQKEEAYLTYYLQMNAYISTDVTECNIRWAERELVEIVENSEVKKIVEAIGEGVPVIYTNIKEILKRNMQKENREGV